MMFSDCCGVQIVDDIAGFELCPRCWEHCEVIVEDENMISARRELENMSIQDFNELPLYKG